MADKKILFVTHLFHPARGGVEIHLTRLSQALVDRGYNVEVLTTNAYSTECFFLGDKRRIGAMKEIVRGVKVERLGFRTYGRRILNMLRSAACRIKYPLNDWIRFYSFGPRNPRFFKRIMEIKPGLILAAPFPTFNVYYAWKAAKKLGIPLIINPAFHISDPCSYSNPLFNRIMKEADLVAVHSETEKQHIVREGGVDVFNVKVFPPLPFEEKDLDLPAVSPEKGEVKKRYGIKQKFVLLFLGQHGKHKNIQEILKAMPRVWDHVPDAALVIAGGTTAYTSKLKQISGELATSGDGKVYFIDDFPGEEKRAIYSMADVFISLSEFESFGIVFVEAMLHRLPVVASVFSIARTIVQDFHSGLLVNPYCDAETSGAIVELLLDKAVRRKYGENGRRAVLKHYAPRVILDQWEESLTALL
jgi:glycosyltransferase involved in cell wall biosynthesis